MLQEVNNNKQYSQEDRDLCEEIIFSFIKDENIPKENLKILTNDEINQLNSIICSALDLNDDISDPAFIENIIFALETINPQSTLIITEAIISSLKEMGININDSPTEDSFICQENNNEFIFEEDELLNELSIHSSEGIEPTYG